MDPKAETDPSWVVVDEEADDSDDTDDDDEEDEDDVDDVDDVDDDDERLWKKSGLSDASVSTPESMAVAMKDGVLRTVSLSISCWSSGT